MSAQSNCVCEDDDLSLFSWGWVRGDLAPRSRGLASGQKALGTQLPSAAASHRSLREGPMLGSHVSGTGFRLTLNRFLTGLTENSGEGLPELTFRSCQDTALGMDGSH